MVGVWRDYSVLAVTSGVLAALSGLIGKLGLDTDHGVSLDTGTTGYLVRALLVSLTLVINSVMITVYTRSLSLSTSGAVASVLNTAANMVTSAVMSVVIFGEHLSLQWTLGAVLIIAGVSVLLSDDVNCDNSKKDS